MSKIKNKIKKMSTFKKVLIGIIIVAIIIGLIYSPTFRRVVLNEVLDYLGIDVQTEETLSNEETEPYAPPVSSDLEIDFEGYTLIVVDGGDLSGDREDNVVVDIGFGDREYYAFTNEHGQLVKVVAEVIILQDDENEPVTSKGRYYHDEAKVPGYESKTLDEGHAIADSLGGVSNAYNITPQNSDMNRRKHDQEETDIFQQYDMECEIRDALNDGGSCTDFVYIIEYPNTTTQIPDYYEVTYILNGVARGWNADNFE